MTAWLYAWACRLSQKHMDVPSSLRRKARKEDEEEEWMGSSRRRVRGEEKYECGRVGEGDETGRRKKIRSRWRKMMSTRR